MIYYISDPHFGHSNIIRLCNRPFSCIEEMDETLIENWNRRVTNGDEIYILGDLIFRSTVDPREYIERLRGKKHLIIGNHDSSWMKKVDLPHYFESVEHLSVFNNGLAKVTACHYPMMCYEGKYLLYGHIHNNRDAAYWPLLQTMDHALNACVEVNGYQPVTFEELIQNNISFRSQPSE